MGATAAGITAGAIVGAGIGQTIIKANAWKVRRLHDGSVIAGFAGSTADA